MSKEIMSKEELRKEIGWAVCKEIGCKYDDGGTGSTRGNRVADYILSILSPPKETIDNKELKRKIYQIVDYHISNADSKDVRDTLSLELFDIFSQMQVNNNKCKNCGSWHIIVPRLFEKGKTDYGHCSCKNNIAGTAKHNEVCFCEEYGCNNFHQSAK